MTELEKEAGQLAKSTAKSQKFPPLGDIGTASVPISATTDDVSFYDHTEWATVDEADRTSKIETIKLEFDKIVDELDSLGDGAAEESLAQGKYKKAFKLTLIILTTMIAAINLFASLPNIDSKSFSVVSALIAIFVAGLGSVDSYLGFSEKSINMMDLHYRCRDTVTNLRARWAVAVSSAPDFKTYMNAWRALDAAQREFQQINKLARRIMLDGESKPSAPTN